MKKRIISFLLVLTLVLGILPMGVMAADRDESKDQVRVIVENTTFTTPLDDGSEPAWTGTLVDTWVDLNQDSTMMNCVVAALDEKGYTQTGAENNYISDINGLAAFDGGSKSGWMGTLNDWFTDHGFGAYTVADGTLSAGDEIHIMYTMSLGADLGSFWGNTDTSLKALTFSQGSLTPAFSAETLDYVLNIPEGVQEILVTPTAANKGFKVHTKVGETEYKRPVPVPVENGTKLTIQVGDVNPQQNIVPTVYNVSVAVNTSIASEWPSFRGDNFNSGLTAAATPRDASEAELAWAKAGGSSFTDAPSPLILVDDAVFSMCGSTLKKFSKEDGHELASQAMSAATNWGSTPPCFGGNKIYCQLNGGVIDAFDAKTLEKVWTYDDPLDGQAQSPIAYADGKIYVGIGYTGTTAFVCLDAADGSKIWRDESNKGYYWTGAAIVGNSVIYGGEDGIITSRNKETGDVISNLTVEGTPNIRSSVSYADGRVFFTTKNADFCSADLNEKTGELTNLRTVSCSSYGQQCTSTPAVYNGIAYFGVGGWSGKQTLVAVDVENMSVLSATTLPANPQSSPLISTAYADSGYIYLYQTCNANPGGIQVIKAKADGSEAPVCSDLYVPQGSDMNYCICSVIADSDGSLYYKNDSGKIFKIKTAQSSSDNKAVENVMNLIDAIGKVTADSADKINAAREAFNNLTEEQQALVENRQVLEDAENMLKFLLAEHADYTAICKATGDRMESLVNQDGVLSVGSIGGEWIAIGMARDNRRVPFYYYNSLVEYVNKTIKDSNTEQLHRNKSSENSRLALALTALGEDPTNVGGHNLLKGLTNMKFLKKQGINGPVWALIAFDSHSYEIPTVYEGGEQVSRQGLVDYLLGEQLADGGWNLSSDSTHPSDPDITAMVLQALAPYCADNEKVAAACETALNTLSGLQNENGGFASWGTENSESTSQVIVALVSLGIDPNGDPRFIKNGKSLIDALCSYYTGNGEFRHIQSMDADPMATEQAYYALVSYLRFLNKKTSLYNMNDQTILPFHDIANNAWYREKVKFVNDNKIMVGTAKGFEPNQPLTRAQMVSMLYRAAKHASDKPIVVTGELKFTDVPQNCYYKEAVIWATENGITAGTGKTTFSPNETVTRAQMVSFLMRLAKYLGLNTDGRADLSAFTDADKIPNYAKNAMSWAVAEELIYGTNKTTLAPQANLIRAQAAAFFCRFLTEIAA